VSPAGKAKAGDAKLGRLGDFNQYPGADLVAEGLVDLDSGRESEAALLVELAAPRLRAIGIEVRPSDAANPTSPEHRLYAYVQTHPDPYRAYNALLARMVSFARAAEHAPPG
jgi:hypothetical protein